MNARFRSFFILFALTSIGCGHRERGRFAAVTAQTPSSATVLSAASVVGRACFGSGAELGDDRVIDRAVSDALAKVPGADGLANAVIADEGNCIRVEGRAVRIGASKQLAPR